MAHEACENVETYRMLRPDAREYCRVHDAVESRAATNTAMSCGARCSNEPTAEPPGGPVETRPARKH